MRVSVLTLSAITVAGLLAGCTLDGHCHKTGTQWTEPGLFDAVQANATRVSPAEPGLPVVDTWMQDRWPDATIESVSWLPAATEERFSEPGHGAEFRSEPIIQLFASRETYATRPGWPHAYPYGPSIDIPTDPFLVVVVQEPDTPAAWRDEVISFLDNLGVAAEARPDIFTHLEDHKEKHTAVRDRATGNETWKYGHWAPLADLPALDPFIAGLPADFRVESRVLGWTDVVFDPQWKISLDQPVRTLELPSSIGKVAVDVDGSDVVRAESPAHYAGDEERFRMAVQDAFQQAGLPATRLGEATVERSIAC